MKSTESQCLWENSWFIFHGCTYMENGTHEKSLKMGLEPLKKVLSMDAFSRGVIVGWGKYSWFSFHVFFFSFQKWNTRQIIENGIGTLEKKFYPKTDVGAFRRGVGWKCPFSREQIENETRTFWHIFLIHRYTQLFFYDIQKQILKAF